MPCQVSIRYTIHQCDLKRYISSLNYSPILIPTFPLILKKNLFIVCIFIRSMGYSSTSQYSAIIWTTTHFQSNTSCNPINTFITLISIITISLLMITRECESAFSVPTLPKHPSPFQMFGMSSTQVKAKSYRSQPSAELPPFNCTSSSSHAHLHGNEQVGQVVQVQAFVTVFTARMTMLKWVNTLFPKSYEGRLTTACFSFIFFALFRSFRPLSPHLIDSHYWKLLRNGLCVRHCADCATMAQLLRERIHRSRH